MSLFDAPPPHQITQSTSKRAPLAPLEAIREFEFRCSCDSCAVDKTMSWADPSDLSHDALDVVAKRVVQSLERADTADAGVGSC